MVLIRFSEIALKKGNRKRFEQQLISNMQRSLHDLGCKVIRRQQRIFVSDFEDYEQVRYRLARIPGITNFSPVYAVDTEFDTICSECKKLMLEHHSPEETFTFKVATKRPFKKYHMTSLELSIAIAEGVFPNFPKATVNLSKPEVTLGLEVHEESTLIFLSREAGVDGLPVSCSGKMLLLLSGGIDSPVAGFKMIQRGVELEAIYFHSFPYTSEGARQKVIDLAKLLAEYQGFKLKLHIIHFTEIQRMIQKECKDGLSTVLGRRYMVRLANIVAQQSQLSALVTGESIGQVASQTIENITVVQDAAEYPILRPLIGDDKKRIIELAQQIGSFDISIRPYEDCCTIFASSRPTTKAKLFYVAREEERLDDDTLLQNAIDKSVTISFKRTTQEEKPLFLDPKEPVEQ